MLITLATIFLFLWLLGVLGTYTLGSILYVLLFAAVAMLLIQIIEGEPAIDDYY
jgi:hypothetical protein